MTINTHFDTRKGIEVMLYIASKAPIPDIYHVCKILYFADKKHLSEYGRQICGHHYMAMNHGPVHSAIYDMYNDVKLSRLRNKDQKYADLVLNGFSVKKTPSHKYEHIIPKREADIDELSPSDIACLNETIEKYGNKTFYELRALSHDSAWESAYDRPHNKAIKVEELAQAALPKSPKELIQYLQG